MRKPNRIKNCPICKRIFLYYGSKNNERKYCSLNCASSSHLGKRKYSFFCKYCGRENHTSDSRIRFCNRKCYTVYERMYPNKGTFKSKEGKIKKDRYYFNLHLWVRKNKSKPLFCEKCGKHTPMVCHNKDGKYSKDLDTWIWLCHKCHFEMHN